MIVVEFLGGFGNNMYQYLLAQIYRHLSGNVHTIKYKAHRLNSEQKKNDSYQFISKLFRIEYSPSVHMKNVIKIRKQDFLDFLPNQDENTTIVINFVPVPVNELEKDFFRKHIMLIQDDVYAYMKNISIIDLGPHDIVITLRLGTTKEVSNAFSLMQTNFRFFEITLDSLKSEFNINNIYICSDTFVHPYLNNFKKYPNVVFFEESTEKQFHLLMKAKTIITNNPLSTFYDFAVLLNYNKDVRLYQPSQIRPGFFDYSP